MGAYRTAGSARLILRHTASSLRLLLAPGLLLYVFLATPAVATGQENDICLMCHSEPAIFEGMENAGDLVVRQGEYDGSVHGALGMQCVDCHMDLAGVEDFPHPETLAPVDCGLCHPEQAADHSASLHGQAAQRGDPLAPSCADCHGRHGIMRHTDPGAPTYIINIPMLCGECHHEGTPVSRQRDIPQDRILENYSLSIHGTGLFQQGLTVTAVCTSCHTSHRILPHTDPRSSIHHDNVASTCMACHGEIEQVHRKVIEGQRWETAPNLIPACVECHQPHKIRRVFYETGASNRDCLSCHQEPDLSIERDGERISLFVDEQAYNASAHSGTACAQCHTEVTSSLDRACETIQNPVDCGGCHTDEVDQYRTSRHGTLAAEGSPDAPICQDCHPKHAEMYSRLPISATFPRNVPDLCARCHREGEKAAVRLPPDEHIVQQYRMSIHGKGLLQSGLTVTATCTSCHTAHHELPPDNPESSVNSTNVPATCGTCHHGIQEKFMQSVHWPGNADVDPERELPTCENCHTSHTISRVDMGNFRLRMMDQCGRCHEEESETFFDTYHGKVSRLGDEAAAKCYDCHGTHDILPPYEAASTLSRRNIVNTCAQCHPGANRRFTGYLTHATHHDQDRYPFLFWAFWLMTALLVGTLTFAFIHTMLWLFRLFRSRGEWKAHKATIQPGGKLFRRFTKRQRAMHAVMLVSFMLLALTGMALKFSYMRWAQIVARVLGEFEAIGVLHRIGAVTLIAVFLIHLREVRRQKVESGRTWKEQIFGPNSIIFNRQDLVELWQSIKWFFGRGERPKYGRYTYWEKFDYFAVFWGMFIIGSTGLLLWFPEFFTHVIPGQAVNVATIIHSDEALLAVGFIFTIHFFNTHFRLDKFPMDPVIFTGRVPVEELEHDKPREYEELVESGKLEERLAEPLDERVERGFKVFGFAALGIGITLIFLIVYTMLFGYR